MSWKKLFSEWLKQPLPAAVRHLQMAGPELFPLAAARILSTQAGQVVIVTADESRADAMIAALPFHLHGADDPRPLIPLPEVASGRRQWVPENEAARSAALAAALNGQPAIFVATAASLLASAMAPDQFAHRRFTLRRGLRIAPEELARRLVELDYDHEFSVQTPGEFARRGGIFDLYSPLYDKPVRIEFFGDEIDSIRFFLPDTQRSCSEASEIRVVPRGAAMLGDQLNRDSRTLAYFPDCPLILCQDDQILAHLREYQGEADVTAWTAALAGRSCSPPFTLLATLTGEGGEPPRLDGGGGETLRGDTLLPLVYALGDNLGIDLPELGDGAALWHWQQLRDNLLRWQKSGYTLAVCCGGTGERDRFSEILRDDRLTADLPISLEHSELDIGLIFPGQRLVLLSDKEIFGRKTRHRRHKHIDYHFEHAVHDLNDLEPGVLAVHASHGLCRYHGIRRSQAGGEVFEAMELEFAGDAKLFVPLDQAHLVSRYLGGSKSTPTLSTLGGSTWKKHKEQAASAAWDLAAELLRIEAMRQNVPGSQYPPLIEWERSFAASFPHQETPDQSEAIAAVLRDLEAPRPMDRLLCGDVGYGKTEVALRAAFRVVLNGRQVAVLVPTTVLAQQHYQTFCERMAEYPVVIAMLSRFKSRAEQKVILGQVARGEVDILIGTHRLLQKDIQFASLGLLVIDEEQRFGVKHKQQLKALRASLDILTMTATPIPRTLYFSLSGLRNLSTIMTPPVDRLPVSTIVAHFDKELIRQAILREMERDGQVFFLHNRVHSIMEIYDVLRELVPRARIGVGHGQMSASSLEEVMTDFVRHKYDILLCTTIIESGIDIANANTIFIDRADRFGLSELYQLRGRVGRYHRQAYAYLLLPPMGLLPENARQRIAAIRRYTHLGAGFRLAMKDLEIRGAGNILGDEQSGHIAAVGFELYCQLLREAVARLENREVPDRAQVPVDLDRVSLSLQPGSGRIPAGFPPEYIDEEGVRVECYKTMNSFTELRQVDDYGLELIDRFGSWPVAVEHLLALTRVRILARQLKLVRLTVREGRLIMETQQGLYRHNHQVPQLQADDGAGQLREIEEVLQRRLALVPLSSGGLTSGIMRTH